ncbi:hypothetical protein [Agrococcus sp. Marseille-Q4369]|uniref:hypothetical protein n=1 Tax=Agrococcus sp. Marseille-Q4369 TaxID=2810513 RepID=UPI001B8DA5AC|nr:hypothetical protein [Agrococcus sp. Marseille-Q4369]QUW18891.1 hypothetical protein JSQ78_00455 [Agrococcus sp. Marseille-Q4369]
MADAHELHELAHEFQQVPSNLNQYLVPALEASAFDARDEWRDSLREVTGSRLRHAPTSIDYDVRALGGSLQHLLGLARGYEAEIGPSLARRQGAMAGWFQEGSVDGVPAVHSAERVLAAVIDTFEGRMAAAVDDAMRGLT